MATRPLVQLIREVRPDVFVAYDERGSYGHPDHVTAHQIATAAAEASGDTERYPELGLPAWSVSKFYNSANPTSTWNWIGEQMRERGIAPEADESGYDYESFLIPDEIITTRVDVRQYVSRKLAAMMSHETQISQNDWLNRMPEDVIEGLCGVQCGSMQAVVRLTGAGGALLRSHVNAFAAMCS